MTTREDIEGRPGYWRGLVGVYGPKEDKLRVLVTKDFGQYAWRYKNPGETHCIYIGPVSKIPPHKVRDEIRIIELIASIY